MAENIPYEGESPEQFLRRQTVRKLEALGIPLTWRGRQPDPGLLATKEDRREGTRPSFLPDEGSGFGSPLGRAGGEAFLGGLGGSLGALGPIHISPLGFAIPAAGALAPVTTTPLAREAAYRMHSPTTHGRITPGGRFGEMARTGRYGDLREGQEVGLSEIDAEVERRLAAKEADRAEYSRWLMALEQDDGRGLRSEQDTLRAMLEGR